MPACTPAEVLEFWFSDESRPHWFVRSEVFDARLRETIGALHFQAAGGELDGWASDARGALALILLLDQAPRNLHRGSPDAFACDAKALMHARTLVDKGRDRELSPTERLFIYLPFEHSESLVDQERCITLMTTLQNPLWLDYAERHRAIIARFGRFPHRNVVVGRESTAEELEFLTRPGSSF